MAHVLVTTYKNGTLYTFSKFHFQDRLKMIYAVLFNKEVFSEGDFTMSLKERDNEEIDY